jgi:cobalt-zinc-cadmium efflux system outer membrane protein
MKMAFSVSRIVPFAQKRGRLLTVTTSIILLVMAGCRTPQPCADLGPVNMQIQSRLLHSVAVDVCPGEIAIPPCVVLEDGLTEEEAVAIALWNNRDFLATLANLGIARGDLVQAGLLTNPQLILLAPPIGTKQLEWALFVPIETLLLRKHRVEIAERDFQRIANEIVQNGLNVARDARVAYADLQFAVERHSVAERAVEIRCEIAELAEKRLSAGDIGELEVITARVDANRTRVEAVGLERAVEVAEARLRNVLGVAMLDTPLVPVIEEPPTTFALDAEALVSESLMIRPDALAADIAVQAAEQRVVLARKSFLRIDAAVDGNNGGSGPSNVGPGVRLEIPVFNRNQGLVLRSEWSVDQAIHNYHSVQNRVATEVRTSIGGVRQAKASLMLLRQEVLPDLKNSIQLAETAYRDGAETYFWVLQSTTQYLDSRIRELELLADLRRALAELDCAVGRRVITSPPVEDPIGH